MYDIFVHRVFHGREKGFDVNVTPSPYRTTRVGSEDRDALAQAAAIAQRMAREQPDAPSPADIFPEQRNLQLATILVMAWRDAEPCGFVCGSSMDEHTFDLRSGGVLLEHRHHGLGMALLQEIEQAVTPSGCSHIRGAIEGDRRSEMRLLIAFGMKVIGVSDNCLGRPIQIVFRKALGDPVLTASPGRELDVTIEAWPIKRLCELEHIYQASFGELLDDGHPALDEMVLLDSTYEDYLHVALVNGEPVGFKQAQERTRGILHSHIGAVHPDARGAGVASKLKTAQHEFAKSHGFGGIATRSRNRYPQMIRLNLKHGFQIVGVVQALGEPAIHMFKRLK